MNRLVQSETRDVLRGLAWTVAINLGLTVAFLIAANETLFSPRIFAVGAVVAVLSAAWGLRLRRSNRPALGSGVIAGASLAVPAEIVLSLMWIIVVAVVWL